MRINSRNEFIHTKRHLYHAFMEGVAYSLRHYMEMVEGTKAELAESIRSSISMPDKSVEERAAYSEMALKQAEYVAENYFDNEKERAAFIEEVNRYYENDLLRERGYVVYDNSDLESFKKYSSPRDNNRVSYMTLASEYMDEDTFEHWINYAIKEETDKILRQWNQFHNCSF